MAAPRPPPQPRPKPASTPPQPPKKLVTAPLAGALALAVIFGYLAAVTLVPSATGPDTPTDPLHSCAADSPHAPTGRPASLSGISAAEFDRELDREEGKAGVTKLREGLAGRASGHVLELAVGTGRNFGHYDWEGLVEGPKDSSKEDKGKQGKDKDGKGEEERRMLSFTGVDIASDMLDVAASKLKDVPALKDTEPSVTLLRDQAGAVAAGGVTLLSDAIRLVKSDALTFLPRPPTAPYYDTIIQTFGLCSVASPRAALANLAPLLRPGTGRIVLLEHGRGTWGVVNWWLDRRAAGHFARYGCWWNRDLEGIVREACGERVGGRRMEVVRVERPAWQGGTVLWIELKVVEE